ncbi:MAG: hypothetical protein ABJB66_07390 [Gemmatimonadaceae bacterium]
MSTVRPGQPGATRTCPHCRQTILESAAVCPACKHHLRSGTSLADVRAANTEKALSVEGTISHPASSSPWEYSVLVTVRDEKGKEISRHVASVGVFTGAVERSFTLAVEVFKPNS